MSEERLRARCVRQRRELRHLNRLLRVARFDIFNRYGQDGLSSAHYRAREVTLLRERDALRSELKRLALAQSTLTEAVATMKRGHTTECGHYSGTDCTCGAGYWNARVDAVLVPAALPGRGGK